MLITCNTKRTIQFLMGRVILGWIGERGVGSFSHLDMTGEHQVHCIKIIAIRTVFVQKTMDITAVP